MGRNGVLTSRAGLRAGQNAAEARTGGVRRAARSAASRRTKRKPTAEAKRGERKQSDTCNPANRELC